MIIMIIYSYISKTAPTIRRAGGRNHLCCTILLPVQGRQSCGVSDRSQPPFCFRAASCFPPISTDDTINM